MNGLQLQLIRSWEAFSQMKRVQKGLFRRGHVETLDARESEKQERSNSGEFNGDALIIDAAVRAHS